MKTLRFSALLTAAITALLFTTVFYTSCKKEETTTPTVDTKCINVECNNGSCYEGQCACKPGWEGYSCDIKSITRYIGSWAALETVLYSDDTTVGDTSSYTFSILPNGSEVLSFKIAGLMKYPGDTVMVKLGNPITFEFAPLEYHNEVTSLRAANVYIHKIAGKISSSGGLMDSMTYERWYHHFESGDTTFRKETVKIAAQKM